MTPHRDDRETLLAENERLRAEVASLRAKPAKAPTVPMRWDVCGDKDLRMGSFVFLAMFSLAYVAGLAILFVVFGPRILAHPVCLRAGACLAACTLAWCLAFVRRVPR